MDIPPDSGFLDGTMGSVTKPVSGQFNLAQPQSWANLLAFGTTPAIEHSMARERSTSAFVRETNRMLLHVPALQSPLLNFFPQKHPEQVFRQKISPNQQALLDLPLMSATIGYDKAHFKNLSRLLFSLNQVAPALGAMEFIAQNENDGVSYFALGALALQFGDKSTALMAFERAFDRDPNLTDSPLQIGRIFYQSKHYEAAARHFLRALAANPENDQAWYWLAMSKLHQNSPEPDTAIKALQKAIANSDPQKNPTRLSQYHYITARIYQILKDYDKAIESYWQSYQADPRDLTPLAKYGLMLTEMERFADAKDVFLDLTWKAPENENYHTELAKIFLQLGEIQNGRDAVGKAIKVAKMPLSSTLLQLSKTLDAHIVPSLKLHLLSHPLDSQVRAELARIHIDFGQYQEALEHYQVLKQIDPVQAEEILDFLAADDALDEAGYVKEMQDLPKRQLS